MEKGEGKPDPAPANKAAEGARVYPLAMTEKDVKPMEFPDAAGRGESYEMLVGAFRYAG